MKKKINNYFIINFSILIIFTIITRFSVFSHLYKKNLIEKIPYEYLNYNFLDFLLFNHTLPNGYFILKKILIIFNFHNFGIELNFYIINVIYSILFLYFLWDILKYQIKYIYIYPLLIVLSVALIPYESWRPGHHDHINLFIFAYIFWSIFYFLKSGYKFNHLFFSLILLNLFYSLGFIYTFFIIFLLFRLKHKNFIIFDLKSNLKIIFLFLLILSIFSKNFINASSFSSTSMGGANLIQRSIHAIGEEKFTEMVKNNKLIFPKWWQLVTNEILKENKNIENVDFKISKLAHGNIKNETKENFLLQKNIIKSNSAENLEINKIIEKDLINFENKFWRYNFGYGFTLISIKYQSLGSKIFLKSCTLYPYEMIIGKLGNKGFVLTAIKMISYGGLFPMYYENEKVYWNILISKLHTILRILILIILSLTPYFIIKKSNYKKTDTNQLFYLLIVTFLFFSILLTSIITCCENPRIMVMHFFIIILITIYNINWLKKSD